MLLLQQFHFLSTSVFLYSKPFLQHALDLLPLFQRRKEENLKPLPLPFLDLSFGTLAYVALLFVTNAASDSFHSHHHSSQSFMSCDTIVYIHVYPLYYKVIHTSMCWLVHKVTDRFNLRNVGKERKKERKAIVEMWDCTYVYLQPQGSDIPGMRFISCFAFEKNTARSTTWTHIAFGLVVGPLRLYPSPPPPWSVCSWAHACFMHVYSEPSINNLGESSKDWHSSHQLGMRRRKNKKGQLWIDSDSMAANIHPPNNKTMPTAKTQQMLPQNAHGCKMPSLKERGDKDKVYVALSSTVGTERKRKKRTRTITRASAYWKQTWSTRSLLQLGCNQLA